MNDSCPGYRNPSEPCSVQEQYRTLEREIVMAGRSLTTSSVVATVVAGVLVIGFGMRPAANTPVALPAPLGPSDDVALGGEAAVVFSGGCFWGVQAVFEHVNGVLSATAGYAGGPQEAARYGEVSRGDTGHAESVRVVYDPSLVSFGQLLQVFFSVVHDPTQLNRQGPDVGPQYRSAIWYTTDAQETEARRYIARLTESKSFPRPIVTEVNALRGFYEAEAYHQDYLVHHPYQPYIIFNDIPKVKNLEQHFPELWREEPLEWHAEMTSGN
jgi:peptide-methionine (S)-S-oxide reductase